MKDPSPTRQLEPPTVEQFRAFVRKIVSVPKIEIENEEKTYRQKRKKRQYSVSIKSIALSQK